MAEKVTTQDCKNALAQAWSGIFGNDLPEQKSKWKRISKRGKKGEPVERVFYHDSLPLQALVVENEGKITKTVIRGFAEFDGDEESESEAVAVMAARSCSKEAWEFLSKYPCYQPSDFHFQMCTEEEAEAEGHTWFQLFPTRDFGRDTECANDRQIDYVIDSHLPDHVGEVTEGTFSSELSVDETTAELLSIGFIQVKPESTESGSESPFVFFLDDEEEPSFGIVARDYWNAHKGLSERDPEGVHEMLPVGFHSIGESVWAYRGALEEARTKLLALGFEEVGRPY